MASTAAAAGRRPEQQRAERISTTDRSRLYSLDALRGVAALAVVFWHWQHFWYQGGARLPEFDRHAQPLYGIFFLFYSYGDLAVDLFFALSGFIFYRLDAGAIADRGVTAWDFAVLRVSRLYPLHLVTLLVVAVGQWSLAATQGGFFVYLWNDARHFVLNLLMLPAVGLERGSSFNAPAWSIGVEFVLYALFFLLCRLRLTRPAHLLVWVAIGLVLTARVYIPIGRGVTSFFMGGLAFHASRYLGRERGGPVLTGGLLAFTSMLWLAMGWVSYHELSLRDLASLTHVPVPILARVTILLLFPLTLLALVRIEPSGGGMFRRLGPLGDISYSSYLWHFPVQLGFVWVAGWVGLPRDAFYSPWMMLGFSSLLIALSVASHRYFEMPAQRRIRGSGMRLAGAPR